eukprot:403365821
MESRQRTQQQTRKQSDDVVCAVCVEKMDYFAIGECGHNQVCWRCIMKLRLKQEKKECPICKQLNDKVLITHNKYEILATCMDPIFDRETGVYYSTPTAKGDILLQIGNYCKICSSEDMRRKFPTLKSLQEHYEQVHRKILCEKCIEHKPVLMYEQVLYDFKDISWHVKKVHPTCYFCTFQNFYDQDSLNRHYVQDHHFCDICKRQGKKKARDKQKFSNLPEFEVFRDFLEIREHHAKKHFVCDFATELCQTLVFEDGPQLASHYLHQHGIRKEVRVEFGFSDNEEEHDAQYQEEQKQKTQLTRENYTDQFPTFVQGKKQILASAGINAKSEQQFPSLIQQIAKPPKIKPQKEKKKNNPATTFKAPDRQTIIQAQERDRKSRQNYAKMMSQIENEDFSMAFDEDDNKVKFGEIKQEKVQKVAANNIIKQQKKKMVVVVNERPRSPTPPPKPKEEVKKMIQREEKKVDQFPTLSNQQEQSANKGTYIVSESMWNSASDTRITTSKNFTVQKQPPPSQQNFVVGKDKKFNSEYPTLELDKKGNRPQTAKPEDLLASLFTSSKPQKNGNNSNNINAQNAAKKKKGKKQKGEAVQDWTQLDKKIDYRQIF